MQRKDHMDAFGAVSLIGFAMLMGLNHVVVKVVNDGLQPVFFSGLRSAGAVVCIWAWMRLRGLRVAIAPGTVPAGLLIGLCFSVEFLLLFLALDLTTVVRAVVLFQTMPLWLSIAAHFLIPGERMGPVKFAGLVLCIGGVVVAMADRGEGGTASLAGDVLALTAAVAWAGIALCVRLTRMSEVRPEMQLWWQVAVSAPLLLLLAPLFGPLIRDLAPVHVAGLGFQIVVVVTFGFIFWLWLLSRYPASGVASFGFLTPIFGVALGWLLLGEPVGPSLLAAVGLVAVGLMLINRPPGGWRGMLRPLLAIRVPR